MIFQRFKHNWGAGLLAVMALVLWSGCQTERREQAEVRKPLPFDKLSAPRAELLSEEPLGVEPLNAEASQQQGDRVITVPQRTISTAPKTEVPEYPASLIKGIKDPEEELAFEINLDNAQITEMVAAFADPAVLNFSYLVDPAVKGAVTVNIKTTMKAKDIWSTMQHLLWLSGAYASPMLGFINILPFEKMPKERRIFAQHEVQPSVEVMMIPLRYKKSSDIVNIIKPFMTDGATATDLADTNSVLIVEAPANAKKLQELINILDNKGEREWPVRCFQCREVESDELSAELQALLPVLGMPIAAATGASGGAIKITSLPRLGIVVVSAAMEEILNEVATWVKILDKEDAMDKEDIFFYNVRHSTVDNLSASLDAFFNTVTTTGPSTTSSSTSSRASSTRSTSSLNSGSSRTTRNNSSNTSSTLGNTNNANRNTNNTNRNTTNNANRNRTTGTNANSTTNPTGTIAHLHQTVFETDVTVYTDSESNRLTIKTTPRTWNMIRAFLQREDVPPRQVSIRAIITMISLSENNEFGISYSLHKLIGQRNQNSFDGLINSAGNITKDSTLTGLLSTATGVGFLYKDSNSDPLAFVKAVAGKGNTRVLSEPHILALSGAQAKINVGQKIAIPTESTSYSDSDTMRSNYEYTDTGVIMQVTPYITAGNDVRLVISQEISAADPQTNVNVPPVINTKTLDTELVVPDNSTLIMGGMIQTTKNKIHSGIPLLMKIPWIGWLFRYTYESTERAELLVLLTVNVIDNKSPQEELVRRYKASLEAIEAAHTQRNMY